MLTRRAILRGILATGAASALTRSRIAGAVAGSAPQRLVLIPSLNGAPQDAFWPSGATFPDVTAPLQPWADQIQFVQGVDIAGAWDHMAVRSMFTGANISSYESPDPTTRSIDQVVASHLASIDPTARASVHLGARPAEHEAFYQAFGRSTFFFDPSPVDYEANPVTAYDDMFGRPDADQPDPEPVDAALEAQLNALTLAEFDDLLDRAQHAPREVTKLLDHRALIAEPNGGDGLAPLGCSEDPIPSVEALRSSLQGNTGAAYDANLFPDIMDAQIDNLGRALVCGLTRVATLQYNSADGNTPVPVSPTLSLPHHDTSHGSNADFAMVQQWYATKLARLLTQLDVPDPLDSAGNTVLHNTVILWMCECNMGHSSNSVPCLYIGSAGGRLTSGGTLATQTTNVALLRTICDAFGVPAQESAHFGDARVQGMLA